MTFRPPNSIYREIKFLFIKHVYIFQSSCKRKYKLIDLSIFAFLNCIFNPFYIDNRLIISNNIEYISRKNIFCMGFSGFRHYVVSTRTYIRHTILLYGPVNRLAQYESILKKIFTYSGNLPDSTYTVYEGVFLFIFNKNVNNFRCMRSINSKI